DLGRVTVREGFHRPRHPVQDLRSELRILLAVQDLLKGFDRITERPGPVPDPADSPEGVRTGPGTLTRLRGLTIPCNRFIKPAPVLQPGSLKQENRPPLFVGQRQLREGLAEREQARPIPLSQIDPRQPDGSLIRFCDPLRGQPLEDVSGLLIAPYPDERQAEFKPRLVAARMVRSR